MSARLVGASAGRLDADGRREAPLVPLAVEDATDQRLDPRRGFVPQPHGAPAMDEAADHLSAAGSEREVAVSGNPPSSKGWIRGLDSRLWWISPASFFIPFILLISQGVDPGLLHPGLLDSHHRIPADPKAAPATPSAPGGLVRC